MFLLNSSISRFIASFCLLNEYLEGNLRLPPNIGKQLQQIDPDVFQRSEWLSLIGGIDL